MNEVRKTDPKDPKSSTLHLAPRGFSAGGVGSFGEDFVWINPLDITALKKLEWRLGLISEVSILITIVRPH